MSGDRIDFYTSYFSKSKDGDLSIATSDPKNGIRLKKIIELTPCEVIGCGQWDFLKMSDREYVLRFLLGLERMDARKIWDLILKSSEAEIPTLCCFEKWDKMCHRHIVADWLSRELGLRFAERDLGDDFYLDRDHYYYRTRGLF